MCSALAGLFLCHSCATPAWLSPACRPYTRAILSSLDLNNALLLRVCCGTVPTPTCTQIHSNAADGSSCWVLAQHFYMDNYHGSTLLRPRPQPSTMRSPSPASPPSWSLRRGLSLLKIHQLTSQLLVGSLPVSACRVVPASGLCWCCCCWCVGWVLLVGADHAPVGVQAQPSAYFVC